MAGFFWTYSFNVNLAMLNVDGKTYAEVQSLLNENVRHNIFFLFFFGAEIVYILGIIMFTAQVNLPLNYYTESWNPMQLPTDWHTVRESWNQANLLPVCSFFVSFLMTVFALSLRKRF